MKNLKYIVIVFIATFFGCSDLEENPISQLDPNLFFGAPKDVQTMVNGALANFAEENIWGRKMSLSIMLRGDMVGIGDPSTPGRRRNVDNFVMNDNSGMVTVLWPRSFQVIAACNEAIAGAATLSDPAETLNPIVGQAYFIKGLMYYHLVRLFGGVPYLEGPVQNLQEGLAVQKTPESEVYEKIIADLETAKSFLPDTQNSKAIPSKAAASAYLASVYLTIGEYQKAYDEAKFLIDNEGDFKLGLDPDYQNLFRHDVAETSPEPIFATKYTSIRNGNFGTDYTPALTGIRGAENAVGGGWSVAVPSIRVYETWDGRDYRKAVSLDTTAVKNGVVVPFSEFPNIDNGSDDNIASAYIAKYTRFIGPSSVSNGRSSSLDYNMMRYAEVLLIAAEALNELQPGSAEATGYVNRVRARARNANGTARSFPEDAMPGLSKEDFRDLVVEERKWELAFEFKRWYDIKRLRIGNEVFGTGGLEERTFNERDYLFPLPGDELVRNPNIGPQNTGY